MATRKTKDLAIVVGSYKDPQTGVDKNRYKTIGHILEKDDGGKFMLIDPLVNLAAAPRGQGRDMVMVSMFDVDENVGGNQGGNNSQAPQQMIWPHNNQPMTPQEVQHYQTFYTAPPVMKDGHWYWGNGTPLNQNELTCYAQHLNQQQPQGGYQPNNAAGKPIPPGNE